MAAADFFRIEKKSWVALQHWAASNSCLAGSLGFRLAADALGDWIQINMLSPTKKNDETQYIPDSIGCQVRRIDSTILALWTFPAVVERLDATAKAAVQFFHF